MKRMRISDMSCSDLAMEPVQRPEGWDTDCGETWDYKEATRCEKCNEVLLSEYGENRHYRVDPESECDGYVSEPSGPMMNYWYPANDIVDMAEAARALADRPLCVVEVDGQKGLALTGGGMDLSWEICEAYMLLGSLPPWHFADLPAMAGRGTSARDRWILAGCRESIRIGVRQMRARLRRLRQNFPPPPAKKVAKKVTKKGGR